MDQQTYYNSLSRPAWAPPSKLFGIVWPFLYVLIISSFSWTLVNIFRGKWSVGLVAFMALNLLFNLLYSPLFFRWRRPGWATADTYLVLLTLVWFMLSVWAYNPWPALILLPYLAWSLFAAVLQTTIYFKNRT